MEHSIVTSATTGEQWRTPGGVVDVARSYPPLYLGVYLTTVIADRGLAVMRTNPTGNQIETIAFIDPED